MSGHGLTVDKFSLLTPDGAHDVIVLDRTLVLVRAESVHDHEAYYSVDPISGSCSCRILPHLILNKPCRKHVQIARAALQYHESRPILDFMEAKYVKEDEHSSVQAPKRSYRKRAQGGTK